MNHSPDELREQIKRELLRIEEDCIHSGKAHFNASGFWSLCHFVLGIPSVMLSALASVSFVNDAPIAAAIMTITITVLTAIQTFVKPSEQAASHKASGDQYLGLRNDARVFREIRLDHACDDQAAINGLDEFSKRRNELNIASPVFGRWAFNKARKGIDAGEAKHAVDKE